jgi:CTP:phosphocholine cytidylyltransferase-like protein
MSRPRVILLAAGQGSRLGSLTATRHKALLPVADEPLLVRTVRQLAERNFQEITVVVGHLRESIIAELEPWHHHVKFAVNLGYASDTNIGSLLLGLANDDARSLIVEADIAFDEPAMDRVAAAVQSERSVWFTNGAFQSHQLGGILRADADGRITDLRYAPGFDRKFSDYRKLLGITYVAANEMPRFHALLRAAVARTTAQYYMMPWCEHLAELPAHDGDLGECRTASFNSPDDYRRCCELFSSPVTA